MTSPLAPPRPPPPAFAPSGLGVLKAIRSNVPDLWPEAAYDDESFTNTIFGSKKIHLLNAPESIRHVLVENYANYSRSPIRVRILKPIMGDGVLLSEGENWRRQRRALAPAFAPRAMPIMTRHFSLGAAAAVRQLHDLRHEPVDLFDFLSGRTLEIVTRSMFSLESDAAIQRVMQLGTAYEKAFARPYLLDVLLPMRVPSPHDVLRKRFRRRWTEAIQAIVDRRFALPADDGTSDLFSLMRAAQDSTSPNGASPELLRDEVATMLVAGNVTTSDSLFWTLFLVASAPETQDRIAAEVRDCDLGADAIAETLPKLVATRAVVNEALRLYPSVFMIVRQARADDETEGVSIRRGSTVIVAPWVVHRHRAYWSNPDVFDPARFLPGAPPPPPLAYLPFGTGPRICIGAHFATALGIIMTAAIVQAFRIDRVDAAAVVPSCVATVRPTRPVAFRVTSRV